ncbi:hypothetical protein BWI17_03555 [Betaproteobacteria bacterium GR16-43]|nr:hypothetical protein BWI17_03555 [Betaproteobacteria bacterium GR16-43]
MRSLLLAIAVLLASASAFPDAAKPQMVKPKDAADFVDVDMGIKSSAGQSFVAWSTYKGKPVSFQVELGVKWEAMPGGPVTMSMGTVTLRSRGAESDAFVQGLAELYGQPSAKLKMAPEVRFTALSLKGTPGDIAGKPLELKLFFEGKGPRAEAYGNIDIARGRFEFHEKDPEYRSALVAALTAAH